MQVVPAFDAVVGGLEVGGKNKLRSEPDQCYGEWSQDNVVTLPKPEVRLHLVHMCLSSSLVLSCHMGGTISWCLLSRVADKSRTATCR